MTQFSSRPPFNDDPEPYRYNNNQSIRRSLNDMPVPITHDPRPEFNRPQHNPTNPILAAFREEIEGGSGRERYSWGAGCMVRYTQREATTHVIGYFLTQMEPMGNDPRLPRIAFGIDASLAHVQHAIRVLTRLANLTKESA